MRAELPTTITDALEQVRRWSLRDGGVLVPEATLVDWLAIALTGQGPGREACCEPFEIVAELTLDDKAVADDDLARAIAEWRPRLQNSRGRLELAYDLAVLAPGERPTPRFADRPRLRALFEVKAANSARALERSDVTQDLRKLAAASAWHEQLHGEPPIAVMVLFATALDPRKRFERLDVIEGWRRSFVDQPPVRGVWLATLARDALRVDLLGPVA